MLRYIFVGEWIVVVLLAVGLQLADVWADFRRGKLFIEYLK